jgi:PAS domain S-box-containing protein
MLDIRPGDLGIGRLFWNICDAVVVGDAENGTIVLWNPAAAAIFGYTAEEIVGRPLELLIPEQLRPAHRAGLRRYAASGRGPAIESQRPLDLPAVCKDGRTIQIEMTLSPIDEPPFQRRAVLAIIRDVTERRRAEEEHWRLAAELAAREAAEAEMRLAALARAEAREEAAEKAAILEQMADAVMVTDAAGRIVLANSAAAALYGVPAERLLGIGPTEQPWQVLDEAGRPIAADERPIRRALRGKRSSGVLQHLMAGGGEHWVVASAAPLRAADGSIRGAIVVCRDVAEERERQQQAARAEKLRALGQLASGVAHDLNQSLGIIAGYSELALQAIDGAAPNLPSPAESLQLVRQAAMDGAEVVKRLLTFSRGQPEGPPQTVDLGSLLVEVAKLTAPRWRDAAQAEGRAIRLQVESDGITTVQGWPAGLREALMNLVFNAVDALPGGGAIRLAAHRRGRRVELEVADTGVGIPVAVQGRIFEPFFTTKGERGSGLGLAQVFGIVDRHGGSVAVDSAPGEGTIFRLSFPAAEPDQAGEAPPEAPRAARPLRILVVDDKPALTRMAALLLGQQGHTVVTANSGEAALEALAAGELDLVLSDVAMGAGMNGWELARRVRQGWPSVRFALATGWGAQIDPEEARAHGVAAVLAKPYRAGDLERVVSEMMG